MSTFYYKAKKGPEQLIEGRLQAPSKDAAIKK
jgi:hypothetical protein